MKLPSNAKELSRNLWLLIVIISILQGCNSGNGDTYYSLQDFSGLKKIDVHAHALTTHPDFVQQAKR